MWFDTVAFTRLCPDLHVRAGQPAAFHVTQNFPLVPKDQRAVPDCVEGLEKSL